jgi:hypothetical protein
MSRSIIAMHFAMGIQERLAEDSLSGTPSPSGDPEERVLLFNAYRHAKRKSRRNPDGLVFLHTCELSVKQARQISNRGYVLKYYGPDGLTVFEPLEDPAVQSQHSSV